MYLIIIYALECLPLMQNLMEYLLKLVHINHAQTMYAPFRTEDIHEYLSTYIGVICNHMLDFCRSSHIIITSSGSFYAYAINGFQFCHIEGRVLQTRSKITITFSIINYICL